MKKLLHLLGLLFCVSILTGNGLVGFAYAVGNAVEPISNGLSLRWERNDIRQKFGEPKAGWLSCEMDYGSFAIHKCYGPDSARVWIHAPNIRLSSGIGVGSSKADVARVFGNPNGAKSGPYKLDFSYNGERVSAIKIDWDAPAGGASAQAPTSSNPSKSSDSGGLAGMYWCIAPTFSVGGTINLLPNGTYEMNGAGVAGHYKAGKGQVQFDGAVKDWNNGLARVENGTLIFEWKNRDGSMQYFAYSR